MEGSHSWNPKPATKHSHFNHPWASNSPLRKELFISQPLLCVGILHSHSSIPGQGDLLLAHFTDKKAEAQKGKVTCPRSKENKSLLAPPLGETGSLTRKASPTLLTSAWLALAGVAIVTWGTPVEEKKHLNGGQNHRILQRACCEPGTVLEALYWTRDFTVLERIY